MKKVNEDGTITIDVDELLSVSANMILEDEALSETILEIPSMVMVFGHFVSALCTRLYTEDAIEDVIEKHESEINEYKSKEKTDDKKGKKASTKKVLKPEPIRKDVIDRIDKFLHGFLPDETKVQIFNTRNIAGDDLTTIYSDDDVIIDHCPSYGYIEVFGLTDNEFECLLATSDKVHT